MSDHFQNTWFFEDVEVGTTTKSPYGRTIRESDISNFAGFSGEYAPIHIDDEYAKTTEYGGIVAQDAFIFTMTTSIDTNNEFMAKINRAILATKGTQNWHIFGKAKVGDTIYVNSELIEKIDNKPTRGIVILKISILNQHHQVLQAGEYHLVMAKRCYYEQKKA